MRGGGVLGGPEGPLHWEELMVACGVGVDGGKELPNRLDHGRLPPRIAVLATQLTDKATIPGGTMPAPPPRPPAGAAPTTAYDALLPKAQRSRSPRAGDAAAGAAAARAPPSRRD